MSIYCEKCGETIEDGITHKCSRQADVLLTPEQLADELHNVGLDAYVNFDYMGKSAALWNKFRLDLATSLLEKMDIKYKSRKD